jgi:hypothetical protein
MKHALTRLDTTNGLEVRCLNAVFVGWKEKGVDALIPHVAHEKPQGRRNVAELLALLDDKRAADALLKQARIEDYDLARVAQLTPLAKWQVADALPVIIAASQGKNDRARGRVPQLLVKYEDRSAADRMVEMMGEETYHVADAALAAMKVAPVEARTACLTRLDAELARPGADQPVQLVRRLLAVAPTVAASQTPGLLLKALTNADAGVRADAAAALIEWKQHAGLLDKEVDVAKELAAALGKESYPFARAALKRAIEKLAETGKNQ